MTARADPLGALTGWESDLAMDAQDLWSHTPRWIRSAAPHWIRSAARGLLSSQVRQNALHEWQRRRRGEPPVPGGPIRKVLVVCHGNICRSPFAGELLARRGPALEVRSAGFIASEGGAANESALRVARELGVELASHAAHRLDGADVDWADLILCMEAHQSRAIARSWPQGRDRVRLLGDYLADPPHSIVDPWGESDPVFAATFEQIARAVDRLVERLAERAAGA